MNDSDAIDEAVDRLQLACGYFFNGRTRTAIRAELLSARQASLTSQGIDVRRCIDCKRDYPQWSVLSSMKCASCARQAGSAGAVDVGALAKFLIARGHHVFVVDDLNEYFSPMAQQRRAALSSPTTVSDGKEAGER